MTNQLNPNNSSESTVPIEWDQFFRMLTANPKQVKSSGFYKLLEEKLPVPFTHKLIMSARDGSEPAALVLINFLRANMHKMNRILCAAYDDIVEYFQSSAIELFDKRESIFHKCGSELFKGMLTVAMEKDDVWSDAIDIIEDYVFIGMEDVVILIEDIPNRFWVKLINVYLRPAIIKMPEQFLNEMEYLFGRGKTGDGLPLYFLLCWTHDLFMDKSCSLLKGAIMSPFLDSLVEPNIMRYVAFVLSEVMMATNQVAFSWPMVTRLKVFNEKLLMSRENEDRTMGMTLCLATIKCAFMHELF